MADKQMSSLSEAFSKLLEIASRARENKAAADHALAYVTDGKSREPPLLPAMPILRA